MWSFVGDVATQKRLTATTTLLTYVSDTTAIADDFWPGGGTVGATLSAGRFRPRMSSTAGGQATTFGYLTHCASTPTGCWQVEQVDAVVPASVFVDVRYATRPLVHPSATKVRRGHLFKVLGTVQGLFLVQDVPNNTAGIHLWRTLARAPVTLWFDPAGTPAPRAVATTRTSAIGAYAFTVKASTAGTWSVRFTATSHWAASSRTMAAVKIVP
jgi:hypothetical protein